MRSGPDLRERVLRETPLGYFADPREIASIAAFLASDDAQLHHRGDHRGERRLVHRLRVSEIRRL